MENGRLPSNSSISSLDVKAETRLVLQAFLHRVTTIPLKDRPGRVGGAYRDHNKYRSNAKEGWDSQAEEVSSADEKSKPKLMDFFKQLPRRNTTLRPKDPNRGKSTQLKEQENDLASPLSTSDEEDADKKKKVSRKKIKKRLSTFFKKRMEKEKNKEPSPPPPLRPSSLNIGPQTPQPPLPVISPNHPPQFYEDVAERLEQIAHKTTSLKRRSPQRTPVIDKEKDKEKNKERIVQQLVHLITVEGDAMNTKIESDQFLRSNLTRLSYASFARLMDAVSSSQMCEGPAPGPAPSPTLRRMAISMEVSRRIVTATGAQRMQGYAECYMETFAPWVKSQGGWENVVDLEDEYD